MPKPISIDLTRRESQIMDILHRRRRAAVEEIRSELPDAPSPSSVRKLLEIMIDRGLLAREYDVERRRRFGRRWLIAWCVLSLVIWGTVIATGGGPTD